MTWRINFKKNDMRLFSWWLISGNALHKYYADGLICDHKFLVCIFNKFQQREQQNNTTCKKRKETIDKKQNTPGYRKNQITMVANDKG